MYKLKLKYILNEISKITGNKSVLNPLYLDFVKFCTNKLSITDDIVVNFKKMNKRHYDGYVSNKNSNIIYIDSSSGIKTQLDKIAHELTHIEQFRNKNLIIDNDYIKFNGKRFISVTDYNNLRDYDEYKKLPWESEAITNGSRFVKDYLNSKYYDEIMDTNPSLKYIKDNDLL